MPPTVKDVARAAGVSTATVSRVLNRVGYVEPETAKAVTEAVRKLGYRRNINWRRLSRKSSDTICFLSGDRDAVNSSLVKTLTACEQNFNDAGYDLIFQTFRYPADEPPSKLRLPHLIANQGGLDGIVLVDKHHGNLLKALLDLGIPYVGLGNNILAKDDLLKKDLLFYDDVSAVRKLTAMLIEAGHRSIAFAGKPEPWYRRRYEGYSRAMRDAGFEEVAARDAWNVPNVEYGRRAAANLLRSPGRPTAIIAGNDEIAAGVWNELMHRGIRIPDDISLAGFGDREEFSVLEPPLTSVAICPERIGNELSRMLLSKLRTPGLRMESRSLECEIMMRRSVASPGCFAAGRR